MGKTPRHLPDDPKDRGLIFQIWLDGEDPPIVPYDAKVHGEGFAVSDPVLKIEFDFAAAPADGEQMFALLGNTAVSSIALQVAGQDIRNVTLQNEFGPLDPAKPFLPFGATPQVGASLVLGSSELFSKTLERITLHLAWEKQLTSGGFFRKDGVETYTARVQHIGNSAWSPLQTDAVTLFSTAGTTRNIALTNLSGLRLLPDQSLKNGPYTGSTAAGFIRLVLQQDFGHTIYIDRKTLALVNIAKGDTSAAPTDFNYEFEQAAQGAVHPEAHRFRRELSHRGGSAGALLPPAPVWSRRGRAGLAVSPARQRG